MKQLYESILDDEDDVMDNIGDVALEDLVKKLKGGEFSSMYNDIIYYDKQKKGVVIDTCVSEYLKGFWGTLDKQDIDVAYISELCIHSKDIKKDFKHKLHIEHLKYLNFGDYAAESFDPNKLVIDKLDKAQVLISGFKGTWVEAFKYIHPEKIRISCNWNVWGKKEHQTEQIKGLKVKNLVVSYDGFPDKKVTPNTQKFILTEDNAKVLDFLFKSNTFDKLFVYNFNTAIAKYEIKKAPRAPLGYKLINIRR